MNKNKDLENEELESYFPEVLPRNNTLEEGTADTPQGLFNIVSGPAIMELTDFIGRGKDSLGDYIEDKKAVNHSTKVSLTPNKESKTLTVSTNKKDINLDITFTNLDIIENTQGPAEKMLILLFVQITKHALKNGELTQDYITFPLKLLTDLGLYKYINGARDGFSEAMPQLLGIQVGGKVRMNKKKTPIKQGGLVLFTKWYVDESQCYVALNSDFNWGFLGIFYTVIPRVYFSIPSKSNRISKILLYACLLARQNLSKIKKKGYFTMRFHSIFTKLGLSIYQQDKDGNFKLDDKGNRIKTKNPGRMIQKDIIGNTKKAGEYAKECFEFKPVYDVNDNWQNQLENGYFKVYPQNEYLEQLIEYASRVDRKNQKRIAAKEKRIEEAKTRNLQKTLEQEAKNKDSKN